MRIKKMKLLYTPVSADIESYVKKKRNIIYGAKAMNANLPGYMARYTTDYDIWSRKPTRDVVGMERTLERRRPTTDDYYIRRTAIPGKDDYYGYGKKVYRIVDKETEEVVVDYSNPPDDPNLSHTVRGIQYQTLAHQKMRLQVILADPAMKFRHEKAQRDLNRINNYLRQKRNQW